MTEEIELTDGQTQDLPETPETSQFQDQTAAVGLPNGSPTMMMNDDRYYSQGEFESAFNEFLIFLKSPQTSLDTFEALRAQGQQLAAGKVYEMAQKYRFLRFLIDRRTQLLHDCALIGIFAACETNAIVYNWTGISLAEKAKIWLKSKIKARAAQTEGKRKGWGFLGRLGAEKPQKPGSSPESLAV